MSQVFWLACLLLLTQGLKISNNLHEFSTGAPSSSHYAAINSSASNATNSSYNVPTVPAPYNLSSNVPTVSGIPSYGALTPSNSSPALVPGPSSFGNPTAYQQLPVVTGPVVVVPPQRVISAPYSPYTPTSTIPPQNGSSVSGPQNGSNSSGFISSNTKQWMNLNAQCPSGSYYSSVYSTCETCPPGTSFNLVKQICQ